MPAKMMAATAAAVGAGFVGLISLFNIFGRIAWASSSDKLGRKVTYFIFFVLGAALYVLAASAADWKVLALFVRYFLTITPPLPQSEQEPARLLGRERFQVFVAQVGRRLATDHRLVSEVLETIASNNPDLFATATDDAPLRPRGAGQGNRAQADVPASVSKAESNEGNGHG